MVLVGFIHDLGKCLCLYGEPQWGVVGDTFPVGCAWSDQVVFPEYFAKIPTATFPSIRPNTGSTNQIAVWKTSTCRLDMTATLPK